MIEPPLSPSSRSGQSGNVLFYVLIGIVLISALTVALRMGDSITDLDRENFGLKATQLARQAASIQGAVQEMVTRRGVSESDLRFAHPLAGTEYGTITTNPQNQVFGTSGGNVEYPKPPAGVNDGSKWEFYGTTAMPQVGSDLPELIAVLPNVSLEFCQAVNLQLGFAAGTMPDDPSTNGCVASSSPATDRFTGTFAATANVPTAASFSKLPAQQACVRCQPAVGLYTYNYVYVLLAR